MVNGKNFAKQNFKPFIHSTFQPFNQVGRSGEIGRRSGLKIRNLGAKSLFFSVFLNKTPYALNKAESIDFTLNKTYASTNITQKNYKYCYKITVVLWQH